MRAGQAVVALPALPGLTHRRHIDLARVNSAGFVADLPGAGPADARPGAPPSNRPEQGVVRSLLAPPHHARWGAYAAGRADHPPPGRFGSTPLPDRTARA